MYFIFWKSHNKCLILIVKLKHVPHPYETKFYVFEFMILRWGTCLTFLDISELFLKLVLRGEVHASPLSKKIVCFEFVFLRWGIVRSCYVFTWNPSLDVSFLWSFIRAGNNQCRFILWSLIIVHQSKQHKPNVVVKSWNWFCTFVNSCNQKSKKNDWKSVVYLRWFIG